MHVFNLIDHRVHEGQPFNIEFRFRVHDGEHCQLRRRRLALIARFCENSLFASIYSLSNPSCSGEENNHRLSHTMDDCQVPGLRNDDFGAIMKPIFELRRANPEVENVTHAQPLPMPTVPPNGHQPATTEINGDLPEGNDPYFPAEQQVAASSDILKAMYEGGLDLQDVTPTSRKVDVPGDHQQNDNPNVLNISGNVLTVRAGYLNSNENPTSNVFETSDTLGRGHRA